MNIIDFIIIFIILLFVGLGYYRGFFKVVINLLEFVLSIFLAYTFYPNLAQILNEKFLLNDFMHDVILSGMKKTIESSAGDSTVVVPIESLDLPIVASMADMIVMLISVLVLFLLFKLIFKIIGLFIDKLTNLPVLKEFNKLGGVVAGFVEGIVIVFICLAILNFFNNEFINFKLEESLLGDTFSSVIANFTMSLINKL